MHIKFAEITAYRNRFCLHFAHKALTRMHAVGSSDDWKWEQCTVEQTELKPRYQTSAAVQRNSSLFWAVKGKGHPAKGRGGPRGSG